MKRSPLIRRTPLARRRRPRVLEPGREAWRAPMIGRCEACGRVSTRLHLHHVIYRQHLRAAGANQWCRDVGMVVCEQCHVWQHSGYKRIPVERIPESALAFAVDVFGEAKAASYLRRYYACEEGS